MNAIKRYGQKHTWNNYVLVKTSEQTKELDVMPCTKENKQK